MRNRMRAIAWFLSFGAMLFCLPQDARAEVHPGLRFGGYFDAGGAFVGGEVLAGLPWRNWYFNPNIEYVFGDHANLATVNFDFHYDFPTRSSLYVWLGGGPCIVHFDPDSRNQNSQTDLGLNLLMGVGFNKGGTIIPYIQPKVLISDHSDFALAFGVRF